MNWPLHGHFWPLGKMTVNDPKWLLMSRHDNDINIFDGARALEGHRFHSTFSNLYVLQEQHKIGSPWTSVVLGSRDQINRRGHLERSLLKKKRSLWDNGVLMELNLGFFLNLKPFKEISDEIVTYFFPNLTLIRSRKTIKRQFTL